MLFAGSKPEIEFHGKADKFEIVAKGTLKNIRPNLNEARICARHHSQGIDIGKGVKDRRKDRSTG